MDAEQAKIDEEFKRIVTTDLDMPKRSKFAKIAILVLLLVAIGAGTWYYIMKRRKEQAKAAGNPEARPSSSTKTVSATPVIISSE